MSVWQTFGEIGIYGFVLIYLLTSIPKHQLDGLAAVTHATFDCIVVLVSRTTGGCNNPACNAASYQQCIQVTHSTYSETGGFLTKTSSWRKIQYIQQTCVGRSYLICILVSTVYLITSLQALVVLSISVCTMHF